MSTILHASDLHLGNADPWERRTDDKAGLVPAEENTREAVLRTSLLAAKRYLDTDGIELDAFVVSGDVTSQNDPEGFKRFKSLLDETGIIETDRLVVVPGNHDVDWKSAPGTPGKYENFLTHTRAVGMRTPICDGVDIPTAAVTGPNAEPILELDDCVLVAVNSANWCGVEVDDGKGGQHLYDVARVSEAQLDHLTDELRAHDTSDKVLLAVLHHHLLPVTEDEEVKPFESFTNLARLRAWLRDHGFHGVLHGHKHRSVLSWDHVYQLNDHESPARRILVVSAPTPTSWGSPVFRVIRIGESSGRALVPAAPRVVIETMIAERHERPLTPQRSAVQLDAGTPASPAFVAIDALTADAAYERLVNELQARPGRLLNVTCVVRDPASAEKLPTNFAGDIESPAIWLDDAVEWWQKPTPALVASGDAAFNHGERLYSSGTKEGPLDAAAKRLGSTKATVLLTTNAELHSGRAAPSFVAVQLVHATDERGDRLDCVGYFRKQDLTLWWPVNIAELRAIQKRVLDLGAATEVRPGHLVTIAAEAVHDLVLPELVGTAVDRFVDLRPDTLMEMAYGAAHGPADERETILKLWTDVLRDIGSTENFPSLGVARLLEHLRVFRDVGERKNVKLLIKRLEAVYDRAHRAQNTSRTGSERKRFAAELFTMVGEVLDAVGQALDQLENDESLQNAPV